MQINADIASQGFGYYLNLYLYHYQSEYLEVYERYLSKKKEAYEELYASGEITNDAVLDCATRLASCMAQKSVLENETTFCRFYLKEYGLNYDDYQVETEKTIHDRAYYAALYEGEAAVQAERYRMNYQNAKALLAAKEVEIAGLKEKVKMEKLLYDAGEITDLEQMEDEVLLKQAEYEKAQYNVSLNEAYYNLERGEARQ